MCGRIAVAQAQIGVVRMSIGHPSLPIGALHVRIEGARVATSWIRETESSSVRRMRDVLVLTGPCGVGKSSVAFEAMHLLKAAGVPAAMIDAELAYFHPKPPGEPFGYAIAEEGLPALVHVDERAGLDRLLLARVVEDASSGLWRGRSPARESACSASSPPPRRSAPGSSVARSGSVSNGTSGGARRLRGRRSATDGDCAGRSRDSIDERQQS